ncbi:MAG TPA: FAD-binding oxidoreductase [Anaerolineales bacterium]|nr:FAD-binding oxidoreductase [Anaerolineales bacterium]
MTTDTADYLILGGGLYGCSIAYNLAKHGAKKVVVLERNSLSSGGTAKSCAIVRTHYSIKSNLIHAVESLKIFSNFDEIVGGDVGFRRTGYLIVGPESHREPMEEVFRTQNEYGIDTAILTPAEAHEFHPLLQFDDVGVIGYDTLAGFADPYLTTNAYAKRARDLGADIRTDTPVTGLRVNGATNTVSTPAGDWKAPVIIFALGPWTNVIGEMIGVQFPYEVSRHKVITLKIDQPYQLDWPVVKDLTIPEKIYFRPETGGVVLVGTGDHGDPITDADTLTDNVDMDHIAHVGALVANRMPAFAAAEYKAGWTGPYDITPDWNPILGPVPGVEGLFVAVGFSGHGFKLAPTLGESLAQTVLGMTPRLPLDMYDMTRFETGDVLHGAYGIGSIS